MELIKTFNFNKNEVRTLVINNTPYFVGKEVAEILGYADTNRAINQHVDREDRKSLSRKDSGDSYPYLWGNSDLTNKILITESGVYSLIFSSKLPSAKDFKHWVTSEVLPSIRAHGAYLTDQKIEEVLTDPDTIISLAQQLKTERTGRLIAEQRVSELQPKATYYDLILRNKSLVSVTKIAKDYGFSGTRLNAYLHELGIQYKQGKTWLLYAKYQDKGYTQSQTFVDDTEVSHMSTYWTQAGRLFIYDQLKEAGILPLIEQETDVPA